MNRFVFTASFAAAVLAAPALAAPVKFECAGPKAAAARKIAAGNDLKLGMHREACFGELELYPGSRKQIVVAAPGAGCAAKLVNVYDRSRAGPWYALFKRPVCGTAVSVGPKSPWGDNMITIDRTSYYEKGDDWVPLRR